MKYQEWTYRDKAEWGEGSWQGEPDKIQFEHEGMPCLIVRGPHGALCGYVGVAEGHPCFGKDDHDFEVHGGITFTDFCQPDKEHGICHIPEPGEPDKIWWLGFDCAHFQYLCPKFNMLGTPFRDEGVYRNINYVKQEIACLAKQVQEIWGKNDTKNTENL